MPLENLKKGTLKPWRYGRPAPSPPSTLTKKHESMCSEFFNKNWLTLRQLPPLQEQQLINDGPHVAHSQGNKQETNMSSLQPIECAHPFSSAMAEPQMRLGQTALVLSLG